MAPKGTSNKGLLLLAIFIGCLWLQTGRLQDVSTVDRQATDQQEELRLDRFKNSVAFQNCSLATTDCVETTAKQLSKVWKINKLSSWCKLDDGFSSPSLLLTKVPKSASSTAASLILRLHEIHQCSCSWKHGKARELDFARNRTSSGGFWMAPVRDPSARAMSAVYFHKVTFHRQSTRTKLPSDSFVKDNLQTIPSNYVTDYLRTDNSPMSIQTISSLMNQYDFLLVVDRLEESIVVLSFLMDISLTDLLIMSSKQSGNWYLSGNRCVKLAKAVYTQPIKDFLSSVEWRRKHQFDRLLYAAANVSLYRTIEEGIGRERFESRLLMYQTYQRRANVECRKETHFPCSSTGKPQKHLSQENCYTRDFGCGHRCIDRLFFQ